jgi:site-specific DNA-methyltransferase (adenine-specific)
MIFSAGQDYHRMYEPCMFGWKKGNKHFSNKRIANFKDVFSLEVDDFSELLDVWYEKRDNTQEYIHPTQKPVRLADRALRKNSKPGDYVIDLFNGSGSTMMACEQLGRHYLGMELDPKFVDAAIERWEGFTGQKAERIVEGEIDRASEEARGTDETAK